MDNEINFNDYQRIQSVRLAGLTLFMGWNPKDSKSTYLLCDIVSCDLGDIYKNAIVSNEYLEIAQGYAQRDCKVRPIRQFEKELPAGTIRYIGIAKDEPERLQRLKDNQISLLAKYGCTEQDAKELCEDAGLLSPVYGFSDRGGCWFCPNAKRRELRHLYDRHPDLWNRMLELQAIPGKTTEKFNRTERFSDIDAKFRAEDEMMPKAA